MAQDSSKPKDGVKFVKPSDRAFVGAEAMKIARDVGPEISGTMACGIATFEPCDIPWTVQYDEYIYCLEGVLRLAIGDEELVLETGCSVWLPKGTALAYRVSDWAKVVYTIYPGNWKAAS